MTSVIILTEFAFTPTEGPKAAWLSASNRLLADKKSPYYEAKLLSLTSQAQHLCTCVDWRAKHFLAGVDAYYSSREMTSSPHIPSKERLRKDLKGRKDRQVEH